MAFSIYLKVYASFQLDGNYRIAVSCSTRTIKEVSPNLMSFLGYSQVHGLTVILLQFALSVFNYVYYS